MMPRFLILFVLLVSSAVTACTPQPAILPTGTPAEVEVATDTPAQHSIPTETLPPMAGLEDEQFDQSLAQAVESLDFTLLRSLMKDRFLIASWQASLMEYASDEALQHLQQGVFAAGAKPDDQFGSDVPALLGGKDPLGEWGPIANPVRALHLTGLGARADEEAVLVIGRDAQSGELFWLGILLPRAGSFLTRLPDPAAVAVTDVQYVQAVKELYLRIGPGEPYVVIGFMQTGEVAQVTGISLDGNWWRIACTSDPSGICWIPANRSEPVAGS